MAIFFTGLLGCSGGDELPLVPVSGVVTFAGGPCPKPGNISFSPVRVEEGVPRRPGRARFAEDGSYAATSFQEGDGLLPGTYTVLISCYEREPTSDDPRSYERFNLVPPDYRPELVVERSSGPIEVNFDVPPK